MVQNDAQSYLKKVHKENEEPQKAEISFFKSMACSMLAGSFASFITNPLDMAKLRL